jgi:DNA-binding PadR family transcriptional regulator
MTMWVAEQAYLVILLLAEQPRRGYAIVGAVLELSDAVTRLGAG